MSNAAESGSVVAETATAIARAIKASGAIVHIEPGDFIKILRKIDNPPPIEHHLATGQIPEPWSDNTGKNNPDEASPDAKIGTIESGAWLPVLILLFLIGIHCLISIASTICASPSNLFS
jgi:hypothetical protein